MLIDSNLPIRAVLLQILVLRHARDGQPDGDLLLLVINHKLVNLILESGNDRQQDLAQEPHGPDRWHQIPMHRDRLRPQCRQHGGHGAIIVAVDILAVQRLDLGGRDWILGGLGGVLGHERRGGHGAYSSALLVRDLVETGNLAVFEEDEDEVPDLGWGPLGGIACGRDEAGAEGLSGLVDGQLVCAEVAAFLGGCGEAFDELVSAFCAFVVGCSHYRLKVSVNFIPLLVIHCVQEGLEDKNDILSCHFGVDVMVVFLESPMFFFLKI